MDNEQVTQPDYKKNKKIIQKKNKKKEEKKIIKKVQKYTHVSK